MLTLIESTKGHEMCNKRESYVTCSVNEHYTARDFITNNLDCSKQWKSTSVDDSRYTYDLTHAGYAHQRYMLYFAGSWIGSYATPEGAFYAAMSHKAEREYAL